VVGSPTVSRGPALYGRSRVYSPSFTPSTRIKVNMSTAELTASAEYMNGGGHLESLIVLDPSHSNVMDEVAAQTYGPGFYTNFFSSSIPTLSLSTSTSESHNVSVCWTFIMPRNYSGGPIIVKVHYTTNYDQRRDSLDVDYRVDWNVYWENIHPGPGVPIDETGFGAASSSHGNLMSRYYRCCKVDSIRCLPEDIGVGPGQLCRMMLRRWRDTSCYSYTYVFAVEVLEEVT